MEVHAEQDYHLAIPADTAFVRYQAYVKQGNAFTFDNLPIVDGYAQVDD